MLNIEFTAWPKVPRLNRDCIITEKIDGTNAAVGVVELECPDLYPDVGTIVSLGDSHFAVYAQSRRRLISPEDDNYGFAAWVQENAWELARILGPGIHFGEWWGAGIQRGYALDHKRFSLFNTKRWEFLNVPEARRDLGVLDSLYCVPVIATHTFSTRIVTEALNLLAETGSAAAPGFMAAEGVVVYHTASGSLYKVLLENDELPKSLALEAA